MAKLPIVSAGKKVDRTYSDKELRKLIKLTKEPGGKKFASAEEFLKHIRKIKMR
jgi:hypothetical protein